MPTYTYQCTNEGCKDDEGNRTVVEADCNMRELKEARPPCTSCGDPCAYIFTPSVANFILKDGASGSWPSKGNRFKQYRQKASEAALVRQKDRYGEKHGAIPNYKGEETGTWEEAKYQAIKDKGLEVAPTFNQKVAEEKAGKLIVSSSSFYLPVLAMARYLSLYRRRTNLVDLSLQSGPGALIAARANAFAYQFQAAGNFDASYTTFQVVPASGGFKSVSAPDTGFDSEQFSQSRTPYLTRFKFAPNDYTTAVAAVNDSLPFWLRVIQVSRDGTTNSPEAGQLILPYSSAPNRPLIITGTAPSETTIASSLELQLPMEVNNVQIQNNGAVPLYVATDPTGPEWLVQPLGADQTNLYTNYPAMTQLFVRGGGGTCLFSLIGALRNNPVA